MSILDPRRDKKDGNDLRQIGLLTGAPMILLAAPLIGFGIGWWLDGKFGTEPYLAVIGAVMGVASAGIEIYAMIKKSGLADKEDEDEG